MSCAGVFSSRCAMMEQRRSGEKSHGRTQRHVGARTGSVHIIQKLFTWLA